MPRGVTLYKYLLKSYIPQLILDRLLTFENTLNTNCNSQVQERMDFSFVSLGCMMYECYN